MKHKGSVSDVQRTRDILIYELYLQLRKSRRYDCLQQICRVISTMKQKQHYISYERGCWLYYHYFTHGKMPYRNKWKHKVYMSFLRSCERIKSADNKLRKKDIVWRAIESEADCIGLGPSQIYKVLKAKGAK